MVAKQSKPLTCFIDKKKRKGKKKGYVFIKKKIIRKEKKGNHENCMTVNLSYHLPVTKITYS